MGQGHFNSSNWQAYASQAANQSIGQVFASRTIRDDFDPRNITVRESCDSPDSPEATPIIIAFDVTGSMGQIPYEMVTKGLGTLINEILDRKPVTNPHIMMMAVGDGWTDRAPLQATQFEADNRIVEQLTDLYLEGNGGGNGSEGYNLPWYFAARKTKLDAVIKGRRKGLLFTIGDEGVPDDLTSDQLKRILGESNPEGITNKQLLEEVRRTFDVFHVVVEEGDYARSNLRSVKTQWNQTLGEGGVIMLSDHTKLAETIVSALEVFEGKRLDDVAKSWKDKSTALTIHKAVGNIVPAGKLAGAVKPANGLVPLDDVVKKVAGGRAARA